LLYPLTAVLGALPLAWLPLPIADLVFIGVSGALLAWGLTRERMNNPQFFVFASLAFLFMTETVQWSLPNRRCARAKSGLCPRLQAAALVLAYPSRRAALAGATLGIITLVLWPWWVPSWLAVLLAGYHIVAPITVGGGPLIALALLKWRRPEARLLVALACVPHTVYLYEAVPLFLVVRCWWEGAAVSALTVVTYVVAERMPHESLAACRLRECMDRWCCSTFPV
jgi:hypothetical protein